MSKDGKSAAGSGSTLAEKYEINNIN